MDSEKNIFEKTISGVSSAVSDAIPRPDKVIRYGILGQPLSEKDRKKQEDLLRVAEENKENTFYGIPIPSKIKGNHVFHKEDDYSQDQIHMLTKLSEDMDTECEARDKAELEAVYNKLITGLIDPKMSNRDYRKHRPNYTFSA